MTATRSRRPRGVLALVGGGEFTPACEGLDRELLAASGSTSVLVLPTAAAFEHPARVVERARSHFAALGAEVVELPVLNRRDAGDDALCARVAKAKFVYVADGSPLHLRSVLKDSPVFDAIADGLARGGVVAASGAGATLVADPMVDPRGGAYTVGLGLARGLAVFPYHGTAADHLRERSIELLGPSVTLAGVDEGTALVRDGDGWRVVGSGSVTLYRRDAEPTAHTMGPVATLALSA